MNMIAKAAAFLTLASSAAFAQDGPQERMEKLGREFERSMKALQEKFEQERGRLQKEFDAAKKSVLGKEGEGERRPRAERPAPPGVPTPPDRPQGRTEDRLERLLSRVEGLEKRLEQALPRLGGLDRTPFKNFDFRKLPDRMPEEWRRWMEQMPKFRNEDFRFEFKRGEEREEKRDRERF